MSKGRFERTVQRRFPWAKLVIAAGVVCLLIIVLLCTCSQTPAENAPSQTETAAEKNPDSIAIPGYEALELKAGSKKQTVCLPNPPQNLCYFQISLYLEDGTLLWQSELIEPGDTSKPMQLTKELEKGTYTNALLRYACFRLDDRSPLNGAEMKLTLWVK
ncbi:MAG: hypothetical protein IJO45_05260 [Oscillospiraceae bacterium]|nr:hypothetical protein [Oscillospiraceae bacterium]